MAREISQLNGQHVVLNEVLQYLNADLNRIIEKLRDTMQKSTIGRAYYAQPTAEA